MHNTLPSYLRTHRRKWALTQQELARLLGIKGAQHISRLEKGARRPSIAVLFSIEIIFGVRPQELFPKFFDDIEERTVRELYLLHEALEGDPKPHSRRKQQLAAEALARATAPTPAYEYQL